MIELISRKFSEKVIHFIACSDKECKHNLDGQCRHILPELIRQEGYGGCWSPIICRSFEVKNTNEFKFDDFLKAIAIMNGKAHGLIKGEIKMSDVKITYKPVDKNKQVFDAIASAFRLVKINDFGSSSVESLAKKIDSIYNAKEEDGEISKVKLFSTDSRLVEIWDGISKQVIISAQSPKDEIVVAISKQQARELGQALIKMSEQG